MAFKSTSERYEYIYGSSVRKLERGTEEVKTVRQSRNSAVPKTALPKKAEPRKTHKVKKTVKKPVQKKKPAKRKVDRAGRERAVERNLAALRTFDWKYTSVIVFSLLLILFGALLYVHETTVINNKERQIYSLKEEKVKVFGKQTAIQSEIDKSIDLTEVERYAKKKLGMIYPGKDETLYYTGVGTDYFRQYESVSSD